MTDWPSTPTNAPAEPTADAPLTLAPHGAKWSKAHAEQVGAIAARHLPGGALVWDPFAGTGQRFHREMGPTWGWCTLGSELEPEWAGWNPCTLPLAADGWPEADAIADIRAQTGPVGYPLGNVVADSSTIPGRFRQAFDGVVCSPTFDNRFADRYLGLGDYSPTVKCPDCDGIFIDPEDRHLGVCDRCGGTGQVDRKRPATKMFQTPAGPVQRPDRYGYTAQLGRPLNPRNTGGYRGREWQRITTDVLRAAFAATRPGGRAYIEMKDALETRGTGDAKRETRVWSLDWLLGWLTGSGLPVRIAEVHALDAAGMLNGENREQRVEVTQLIVVEVLG